MIEGAETEARQHEYFLLSSSASDPQAFHELVNELIGHRRVDGLILINPYADDRYKFLPRDFPLVFVGARSHDEKVCSIALDDEKVAYEATQHLIALGHTNIAMITGPMEEDCSQDRTAGYSVRSRKLAFHSMRPWSLKATGRQLPVRVPCSPSLRMDEFPLRSLLKMIAWQ